jgi:protein phosphatase
MTIQNAFGISSSGFTHVGMRRTHNEDAYTILPEQRLFIVADGMGGHNSGEIASKLAIETVTNFFKAIEDDKEITWPYKYDRHLSEAENRLKASIKLANDRIWETSKRNDLYHGMGTTIVAIHIENGVAYIANVGDSRCYLLRDGALTQVSIDHSLLNDYLKTHEMSPEEIRSFPHKNVIVRALGIREHVEVDLFKLKPRRGDTFMMCSDGLSDMVEDSDIQDLMAKTPDLSIAAKLLAREANQNGGNDNITSVLVRVD